METVSKTANEIELKQLRRELKRAKAELVYNYDIIEQLNNKLKILEYMNNEDKQGWKFEMDRVREEAQKKVNDAEYSYKKLVYETNLLNRTQSIHTKYINELEDILRHNNIVFGNARGEYKDALKEAYNM